MDKLLISILLLIIILQIIRQIFYITLQILDNRRTLEIATMIYEQIQQRSPVYIYRYTRVFCNANFFFFSF